MKREHSDSMPDPSRDPVMQVLRPLVEAYWAFWRVDSAHIRSLHLTPAQFDVMVTLGYTDGMTCSQLSKATLLTKGTMTGLLDRLAAKKLIERAEVEGDRRQILIRLTKAGHELFRKVFPKHTAFLKPFFDRAISPTEAKQMKQTLERLRNSFREEIPGYESPG
jgi:MarR family transcriptional regulator, 2-MHQ and catechol-resistance regulon repressor